MADKAAAKINVTKPLEPQPKPFRTNLTSPRTMFEKDNNEANEIKNKRADNKREEDKIQNGNAETTPPKPLPRVSRTGSVTGEDSVPKPRPRTNSVQTVSQPPFICSINISAGYKVRIPYLF